VLAQRARDIIDGKADTVPEKIQFALSIVSSLERSCRSSTPEPSSISALQVIAGSINPYLSRSELDTYWQNLINICDKSSNQALLNWINLHAAIAKQDMKEVADLTNGLLTNMPLLTVDQTSYLVTSALLSNIMSGNEKGFYHLVSKYIALSEFQVLPFDMQLLIAFGHRSFNEKSTEPF
jgi:hypothetical protein